MASATPMDVTNFEDIEKDISVAEVEICRRAANASATYSRALTRARHSYEDLNQKYNATEGGKPGIDGRRIGEENRCCGQFVEWDEGNDKCSKRENVGIW
jgi:hypothetical protein